MQKFIRDNAVSLVLVVACTALAGHVNGLRKQTRQDFYEIRELQRIVDAHDERFDTLDRRLISVEDTRDGLIYFARVAGEKFDAYDVKLNAVPKVIANQPTAVEGPWVPTTKLPDPDDTWFRSIGLNRRWVSEKVNF